MAGAAAQRDLRSYAIAAGLVWALVAITTLHHQWLSDWWIHLATVREAARSLVHPRDPLTGTQTPFPYYSPYTLALGWLVRVTGSGAEAALELTGLAAVAAWLAALRYFVRSITRATHAATWVLVFTLFLWGPGVLWWSGFFSLGTLSMGPAWPSVPAGAMWLVVLAAAWRWLDGGRNRLLVMVVTLPPLICLVHPWTGVLAAVALTALFLGRARRASELVPLVGAGLATLAVLAAWPYWRFWELFGRSEGFTDIHAPLYIESVARFGLVLICLPAIVGRFRASWRDPLGWWYVIGLAVVAAGGATDQTSLGRAWPLAMLGGHTALGVMVAERGMRRWLAPVLVAALALGVSGQLYAFLRVLPPQSVSPQARVTTGMREPYPDASWVTQFAHEGDAVIAGSQFYEGRQLPALGLNPVAPPWPDPLLPDGAARTRGREQVLGGDGAARRAALGRWQVRWVLTAPGQAWSGAGVDGWLVARGPDGVGLYRTTVP